MKNILILIKEKDKRKALLFILIMVCLAFYTIHAFRNSVYRHMDLSIYPNAGLMFYYKLHDVGMYLGLFLIYFMLLPNLGSASFLEMRNNHFVFLLDQRLGKNKVYLMAFFKVFLTTFVTIMLLEIFILIIIHCFCLPFNFNAFNMYDQPIQYMPMFFFE